MDKELIERMAIDTRLMFRNFVGGLESPWVEGIDCTPSVLAFAALVAEECAKMAEEEENTYDEMAYRAARDIAAAIRKKFGA